MTRPANITITRSGGLAAHWERVVERCERGEAQTLKNDDGVSVLALPGENGASGLVIKRWELRTFGARLKSSLHASRAWRHWKGADRLTKAGVRTATCYAIARSTGSNGITVEWLIMDRLPGKTLLQHMADRDLSAKQEHTLARAIGRLVGSMGSLYNRDGKPSNFIVVDAAGTAPTVVVIDCVAIRRLRTPMLDADDAAAEMLANLLIEPIGCRVQPRRTLRVRTLRAFYEAGMQAYLEKGTPPSGHRRAWRAFRSEAWKAVADHIATHGDPTPKVNPLANPASPPAATKDPVKPQ